MKAHLLTITIIVTFVALLTASILSVDFAAILGLIFVVCGVSFVAWAIYLVILGSVRIHLYGNRYGRHYY
jgi:hypothetical protein